MKRVGVFSGTFDPVHVGHVEVCLVAKAACELDDVLVFVEQNPDHKQNVSAYVDRQKMTDLAFAGFHTIRVVNENIKQVTLESTQEYLAKHYSSYQPVLIIGSDMVKQLEHWKSIETILQQMELCVFLRNLKEQKTIEKLLQKLNKKYGANFKLLPPVWSAVSSSVVKDDIKKLGTSDLIHKNVLRYIKDRKLYSSSSGTSK